MRCFGSCLGPLHNLPEGRAKRYHVEKVVQTSEEERHKAHRDLSASTSSMKPPKRGESRPLGTSSILHIVRPLFEGVPSTPMRMSHPIGPVGVAPCSLGPLPHSVGYPPSLIVGQGKHVCFLPPLPPP